MSSRRRIGFQRDVLYRKGCYLQRLPNLPTKDRRLPSILISQVIYWPFTVFQKSVLGPKPRQMSEATRSAFLVPMACALLVGYGVRYFSAVDGVR